MKKYWIFLMLLQGCGSKSEIKAPMDHADRYKTTFGSLVGSDTLVFSAARKKSSEPQTTSSVNPHLWRASLDTLSFMPLASIDAVGGVIVTDWYVPSNNPSERLKVSVYITSKDFRADALRVCVYRQKKGVNVDVLASVVSDLQNLIIKRAKELNIKTL